MNYLDASAVLEPGARVELTRRIGHFPTGTVGVVAENGLNEIWATLLLRVGREELAIVADHWLLDAGIELA